MDSNTLPDHQRLIDLVHRTDSGAVWVFTGDSITQASHHTAGARGYSELFAERLRYEYGAARQIVVNTAISGERTGPFLDDFTHRVERFQPAVVSMMWGMNDAVDGPAGHTAFRTRFGELIERTRRGGAIPLIHTPPAIDVAGEPGRADLPQYVQIIREVSAALDCFVVDHHQQWLDAGDGTAPPASWLGNAFHPNAIGHRQLAESLFAAVGIDSPR